MHALLLAVFAPMYDANLAGWSASIRRTWVPFCAILLSLWLAVSKLQDRQHDTYKHNDEYKNSDIKQVIGNHSFPF
jgi:hypothetical protein